MAKLMCPFITPRSLKFNLMYIVVSSEVAIRSSASPHHHFDQLPLSDQNCFVDSILNWKLLGLSESSSRVCLQIPTLSLATLGFVGFCICYRVAKHSGKQSNEYFQKRVWPPLVAIRLLRNIFKTLFVR